MSPREEAERLAAELETISEQVGELTYDALADALVVTGTERQEQLGTEKALARARRAIDKAAEELRGVAERSS